MVAARGWLIITRDSKIIENRNEIDAVRESNAKMVALNQRDAQTNCRVAGCYWVAVRARSRVPAVAPMYM